MRTCGGGEGAGKDTRSSAKYIKCNFLPPTDVHRVLKEGQCCPCQSCLRNYTLALWGWARPVAVKILLQGSDIRNGLKGNGTGGNCGNFTAAATFARCQEGAGVIAEPSGARATSAFLRRHCTHICGVCRAGVAVLISRLFSDP